MNETISETMLTFNNTTDYSVIIPVSVGFAIFAVIISSLILLLIIYHRRLHTVTHLLIGNTCIWSIFYCVAQSNHFIYLLFITWDTSDISCRWRGYFVYMTIAGVMYSYLIQAISRFFFITLGMKYRLMISFKVHFVFIGIQWATVMLATLPAIVTKDIFYRFRALCWVNRIHRLHVYYTFTAYYGLPTVFILISYIYVCCRAKSSSNRVFKRRASIRQQTRDFTVFRNAMILFGIYLSGGIPTTIYIFTSIDIFYYIGIVFVSLTIAVKNLATLYLDRELSTAVKTHIRRTTRRILPVLS